MGTGCLFQFTYCVYSMLNCSALNRDLMSSVLSRLLVLFIHLCRRQCGPRSDYYSRNSLVRANTVCLYTEIGP